MWTTGQAHELGLGTSSSRSSWCAITRLAHSYLANSIAAPRLSINPFCECLARFYGNQQQPTDAQLFNAKVQSFAKTQRTGHHVFASPAAWR
jgi:hypothetical protein